MILHLTDQELKAHKIKRDGKLIQYKKSSLWYIPLGVDAVGLKMLESDAMFLSVKRKDGHLAFFGLGWQILRATALPRLP